jgi:DNA-directed RNA polymerase subunit RPC12/RpoP
MEHGKSLCTVMFDTPKGLKIFNDVPKKIYNTLSADDIGMLQYYFSPRLHERGFIHFDRYGKSVGTPWTEPICRSCGATNCREQFDLDFACKYCSSHTLEAKKALKINGKRQFLRFKLPDVTKQRAIVESLTEPYKIDDVSVIDIAFITQDGKRRKFKGIGNLRNISINDVGVLCYADSRFKNFMREGKSSVIYKSLKGANCRTCGAVIIIDKFCTGIKCKYCNNIILAVKHERGKPKIKRR